MLHPQTKAIEITPNCEIIGKKACCAFVAMWIAGYDPDDAEAISTVSRAIKANVLEKDCTVLWVPFFQWLTGRKVSVIFRDIKSLNDLIDEPGRVAVNFVYNGNNHWVGVENGKVCFNSLDHSECVTKGKPVTARIIKLASGEVL